MASTEQTRYSPQRVFFLALSGLVGAGVAASLVLWMKYGTTIFFESIRTGLASCFG